MTKIKTVHDLIPYQNNTKIHDDIQIAKISNSIKAFGFWQPVLIDQNGVIIVGHGRVEAAKKLGITEVKVGTAFALKGENFIPCIQVEKLTADEIDTYRLTDNKLNESDWDNELVRVELARLSPELVDLTGFNMEEINPTFEPIDGDMAKLDEKKQVECPNCHEIFTP